MVIVFDMDNTLIDDFGTRARPGIADFLRQLQTGGYVLKLWTTSPRGRSRCILREHNLLDFFTECYFQEDYDDDAENLLKDIRKMQGDILIDDDPKQVEYMKEISKCGILISPFRKSNSPDPAELRVIYNQITGPTSGCLSVFF